MKLSSGLASLTIAFLVFGFANVANASTYVCSSDSSGIVRVTIDEAKIAQLSQGSIFSYKQAGRRVNAVNGVVNCRVQKVFGGQSQFIAKSICKQNGIAYREELRATRKGELIEFTNPFNSGGEGSGGSEGSEKISISCVKI